MDLGRELLAVPGSILSPESRGTNYLIANGACCIIDEIFYMSIRIVETLEPIADKLAPAGAPFASAAVHFARCGMDSVRILKAVYSTKMNEPVFAHTTKREPEIAIENNKELFDGLIARLESEIC